MLMALVTVLWALFGYSLAFHEGGRIWGGFGYLFLRGVGATPNATYAATIPHQTFMVYQLMFAIITPALITGAFAERMKFTAMLAFMALWSVIVYDPMAHMVWGSGGLLSAAGGIFPTLDFAGGTVVHITSGVSALVCAIYLGTISGAVAGLVAITPASGFVGPMPALVIGLAAGIVCYLMVTKVKHAFGYDDSLDAFGVHGIGGTLGAILTGVFAAREINPIFKDSQGTAIAVGLIDGNAHQLVNQTAGVAVAWAIAVIGTLVILKIVDVTIGLRVTPEQEIQGLDVTQHGEEGYNLEFQG